MIQKPDLFNIQECHLLENFGFDARALMIFENLGKKNKGLDEPDLQYLVNKIDQLNFKKNNDQQALHLLRSALWPQSVAQEMSLQSEHQNESDLLKLFDRFFLLDPHFPKQNAYPPALLVCLERQFFLAAQWLLMHQGSFYTSLNYPLQPEFGTATIAHLLLRFGSPEAIFTAATLGLDDLFCNAQGVEARACALSRPDAPLVLEALAAGKERYALERLVSPPFDGKSQLAPTERSKAL